MPISLNISDRFALHLIRFEHTLVFDEFQQLARLHQQKPEFAMADVIHIVGNDADFSAITRAHIDELRACYKILHSSLDQIVLRRSVWTCSNASAQGLVEYWLKDRHSGDGQQTDVRLVANLYDALGLYDREELDAAATGRSFVEFGRFVGESSHWRTFDKT